MKKLLPLIALLAACSEQPGERKSAKPTASKNASSPVVSSSVAEPIFRQPENVKPSPPLV
ncbi:hypothetical protein ACKLNO_11065 [Neisseriaceae bacterium B1]